MPTLCTHRRRSLLAGTALLLAALTAQLPARASTALQTSVADPAATYTLSGGADDELWVANDQPPMLAARPKPTALGEADAMNLRGVLYAEGREVPQDYATAVAWYQKAAEHGSSPASVNVATAYYYGLGVPRDAARAVGILRSAAAQGDAAAATRLGALYVDGEGVARDPREARALFRQAALQGYPAAMAYLGRMYTEGLGGRGDDVQGFALLQAALRLGVPASLADAAFLDLGFVTARLDPHRLAAARDLATQYAHGARGVTGDRLLETVVYHCTVNQPGCSSVIRITQ